MRKLLRYFALSTVVSSSALPATACTFNFYIDRATDAAIKSFADQTSNVVKSLVLGKEKSVDTSKTINDIMADYGNPSISNLTPSTYNNLTDFTNSWGENNNINFKGLNPTDYFVATGQGDLTNTVNAYQQTDNTLASIKAITNLSIADNTLLYGQFQNNTSIKNSINTFLNNAKKTDPTKMDPTSIYIRNMVIGKDWNNPNNQTFKTNVVDPLTFLLNYLVDNKWSATQDGTTPADVPSFKTFMGNWKKEDGSLYSEWESTFFGSWNLSSKYYKSWNQTDFNFYRAGVLLNWVFYKIGKDYQLKNPKSSTYKNRYLGGIISDHVTLSPIGINEPELLEDLAQYKPHLLENPLYIITLAQALIPVIKYFGLNGDATKGTGHLTFGDLYPTDKNTESYNFGDLINILKDLVSNPDKLKIIVKTILGWAPDGTPGRNFLYDISVGFIKYYPLGDLMKEGGDIDVATKNSLVDSAMGFLTSSSVVSTINTVDDVYNSWIKPYNDRGQGIDISLQSLKEFLINSSNGLLNVISQDLIIGALYPILIEPKDVDPVEYNLFFQKLGGQLPDPNLPLNFRADSILDLLHQTISNPTTAFGKICLILFGNTTQGNVGVFDNIANSNNLWIANNYTAFFDANNLKTGKTSNQKMTTKIVNNTFISTLQYNFTFTINNKTYTFAVKCISHNDVSSFKGTKTFRFTDIDLLQN